MHTGPTAIQPGAETRSTVSAVTGSGASVQSASPIPHQLAPSSSAAAHRCGVASRSRERISTPNTRQASAETSGSRK